MAVSLEHVIRFAECNRQHPVVFERRPARFKFGVLNYGEFVGWRNEADGDCWDAFAPGFTRNLKLSVPFRVKRVVGIVFIDNGNHKIAVELFVPGCDETRVHFEACEYARKYSALTKRSTRYLPIEGLNVRALAQYVPYKAVAIRSNRRARYAQQPSLTVPSLNAIVSVPKRSSESSSGPSAGSSPNDSRPLQQFWH